jgi:hypothetical protein
MNNDITQFDQDVQIDKEEEPYLLNRDPFQHIPKTATIRTNNEKSIKAERIKNAFKDNLRRSMIYRFGL